MDARKIILKHSFTDAKDCPLEWEADFGKMIFTMRVDFISPYLLLIFLHSLHKYDDRFARTNIIGALAITKRFDVRLVLPSGTKYKLRAYETGLDSKSIELELFEVSASSSFTQLSEKTVVE